MERMFAGTGDQGNPGLADGLQTKPDDPMSSARSELMTNKSVLSEVVDKNFDAWDADKNKCLDINELGQVIWSEAASVEQRAAADILSKNFNKAKSLSLTSADLSTSLATPTATNRYVSYFGNDTTDLGITRNDLAVLKSLSSPDGMEKFTKSVASDEKQAVVVDGICAGISAVATVLGAKFLLKGINTQVAKGLTGLGRNGDTLFGLTLGTFAGAQTAVFGKQAYDGFSSSGVPQLEEQFKLRQEMLNSWTKPV